MLKSAFLYLFSRRYVGRILAVRDENGAMPLEVKRVSLLGVTGVAIDGDLVRRPWSSIDYVMVGADSERQFRDRRAMLAKRNAATDAGDRSDQGPMFPDEQSAMEFLQSVGIER